MSHDELRIHVDEIAKLDVARSRTAVAAFDVIARVDCELANLAIAVFEGKQEAALWFAEEIPALGHEMPLKLLLEGKRDLVVDCLYRIEHGIFA